MAEVILILVQYHLLPCIQSRAGEICSITMSFHCSSLLTSFLSSSQMIIQSPPLLTRKLVTFPFILTLYPSDIIFQFQLNVINQFSSKCQEFRRPLRYIFPKDLCFLFPPEDLGYWMDIAIYLCSLFLLSLSLAKYSWKHPPLICITLGLLILIPVPFLFLIKVDVSTG